MIIATRTLTLRDAKGSTEIPVRVFAPEPQEVDWSCRIEIDWPEGKLTRAAVGVDAVQAIDLAFRMIGAQIYTSNYHESGRLHWLEPGSGYGFPVPNGIRDLLIGNDKKFL